MRDCNGEHGAVLRNVAVVTLAEAVSRCTIASSLAASRLARSYRHAMEARMRSKQALVLLGMALAVVALLVLISLPGIDRAFPAPEGDDVAARLAFAAKWLLVPALCLLAGIGTLALALPHDQLGLIGVLAIVFATGRVLFWSGY